MSSLELGFPFELWLIRHGESMAQRFHRGEETRTGEDENPALSALGEQQAQILGHSWRNLPPPDVVFCSPLKRTMQTCEIALANAGWNLTPRILNNGFEQSYGTLANLTIADLEHHGKEQLRKQQLGYWAYEPEGGENWATVDERARRVLTIIRAQAAGKRAIFFGHQVFNHLLRRQLEGWSIEETVTGDLSISHNCAVTSYKLVRGKMVLTGECLRCRRLEELTPGH